MMRVLMIRTNRVDPDPRVEKEVNSLLLNKDITIEVLAWDRESDHKCQKEYLHLSNGSVVIYRIGIKAGWGVGLKKNAKSFGRFVLSANKWLRDNISRYDCIHACDLHTIIPLVFPLKVRKRKLVYDIFDYFSDTAHGNGIIIKLSRKMETAVINRANATIICSEKRRNQIIPANPKKLLVIHNSPSEKQFLNFEKYDSFKERDKRFSIVYVGNLVDDRCILYLLETISKMNNVELHIGGVGSLEKDVNLYAKQYDNIYYYGKMSYSDVLELENKSDIMVALYDPSIPNHKYAAPNKFYEAIALGKPIIMFHNTGVDDIVDKYSLGETINYTQNGLRDGINNLIGRFNEWSQIKEEGQRLFKENYSWEIMEKRLNDMYSELVMESK